MPITWGAAGVFGSIGKAIKESQASSVDPASILSAAVSFVQNYIEFNFRYLGGVTWQGFNNVFWEGLVDRMVDDSQTVNGNAVTAGAVSFSGAGTGRIQNAAITPVEGQVTPTQMLLDDDVFRIVCTAAAEGRDTWAIHSMRRGQLGLSARTETLFGEELTARDVGGISFTILQPEAIIDADPQSVLSAFAITGGDKAANCDSDAMVYVEVEWDSGGYHMTGYPSSTDRTNKTNAVFSCDYSATGTHAISEENSSGLSGTVTVDTLVTSNSLDIILEIPYEAGDQFDVAACTSDDGGLIQSWFRDNYQKTLPYNVAGGETIADSLAQ